MLRRKGGDGEVSKDSEVRLVKGSEEIRYTGLRGVSEDKMHFQLLFEDRQRGDRPL